MKRVPDMTGHALIVDALATNRIVLKATLTASFYMVTQASNARDATKLCAQGTPDVIIIGADLPDMEVADLIQRLDRICPSPAPPVMMLLPQDDPMARLSALQAGVADVMAHPLNEDELFARLRALLRQRRLDSDLVMHVNTAAALGFSEDPAGFSGPERAAVLSSDAYLAEMICARLAMFCRYDLVPVTHAEAATVMIGPAKPDIGILHISEDDEKAGLRSLTALQSGSNGRELRLIALDETHTPEHSARLLDMGACDVVQMPEMCEASGQSMFRELAYRMTLHMARKKRSDTLRGQLENGLQAAVLDPLTGLHNRRYAQMFLRRMLDEAQENGDSCAVMIADLDHFKAVNDTYGHAAGDRVLTRIASIMRAALPNDAMLARVGGEEFLIAVPGIDVSDLRGLAGRLGRMVREAPIAVRGEDTPLHVTVSIGATLVSPEMAHDHSSEALMEQADKALYASKSGGRDTVTVRFRTAA
ncbi:MAG: diguanylate cyclase [Pseudomonadota bacterium]